MCKGSEVTLHCDVTGNPSPYVAWIDASGTVLQNSTNVTSYTISDVTRIDEGNYTCSASNIAGKDVNSTRIHDVLCKCRESTLSHAVRIYVVDMLCCPIPVNCFLKSDF